MQRQEMREERRGKREEKECEGKEMKGKEMKGKEDTVVFFLSLSL